MTNGINFNFKKEKILYNNGFQYNYYRFTIVHIKYNTKAKIKKGKSRYLSKTRIFR